MGWGGRRGLPPPGRGFESQTKLGTRVHSWALGRPVAAVSGRYEPPSLVTRDWKRVCFWSSQQALEMHLPVLTLRGSLLS